IRNSPLSSVILPSPSPPPPTIIPTFLHIRQSCYSCTVALLHFTFSFLVLTIPDKSFTQCFLNARIFLKCNKSIFYWLSCFLAMCLGEVINGLPSTVKESHITLAVCSVQGRIRNVDKSGFRIMSQLKLVAFM
uniref:Uncharacterized protein n=1 Tax=Calidris pygmaea TaxID=425635 RepID=A0A8C3JXF1_9CHAR